VHGCVDETDTHTTRALLRWVVAPRGEDRGLGAMAALPRLAAAAAASRSHAGREQLEGESRLAGARHGRDERGMGKWSKAVVGAR
jgi:hypothetical protein